MDEAGTTADGWITIAAVAERCEVGRMTVHRAAERGELPYAVLCGVRYFDPAYVDDWKATRARAAA